MFIGKNSFHPEHLAKMGFLTRLGFESLKQWVNIREHESLPKPSKAPQLFGDMKDASDEFHHNRLLFKTSRGGHVTAL
jgi:hypothetical protein